MYSRLFSLSTLLCVLTAPVCLNSVAAPAVPAAVGKQGFHAVRLPTSFFAENRARLLSELKKMGPGTIAVIKSMPEQHRNGDSTHMYRQDSDFYYLTGVEEAESVAVLDADSNQAYTLYVRKRDQRREAYDGARLGVEGALKLGADKAEAFPVAEDSLKKLVNKAQRVVLVSNFDEDFRRKMLDWIYPLGSDNNHSTHKRILVDGRHLVAEMRLIKQAAEIDMLQRAVDVTIAGHLGCNEGIPYCHQRGRSGGRFSGHSPQHGR